MPRIVSPLSLIRPGLARIGVRLYCATAAAMFCTAFVLARPAPARAQAIDDDAAAVEFFEEKVRPLLVDHCYACHSAETNSKGGLRVDDRNGLLQGGDHGPAIVVGKPLESLLIRAVSHANNKLKMPPDNRLSGGKIAILAQWIADGAAWTKVRVPASLSRPDAEYDRLRKEHWAWQPIQRAPAPQVGDSVWPHDDLDRFVLARLEECGLTPVSQADRLTLIRRVTFDLTGLPPTPLEVSEFLNDPSPQAFESLVDRLLASPAYGERWGRHWLDVARYAESSGSSKNMPYPHAWRYRDYVIAALNHDKPYNRFLREQIAGDLLPAASQRQKDEQLVATGFLALGVRNVNQQFPDRYLMDNVDEQIDTVTRSVLALTASCARCHNHKFDPIPTTDYYALAGIFRSTELCDGLRGRRGGELLVHYDTQKLLRLGSRPTDGPSNEKIAETQKAFESTRVEFHRLRNSPERETLAADGRTMLAVVRQNLSRLQIELDALADPAATGAVALGVRDSLTVGDTQVRIRGETEKLGPTVPRGFLSVVDFPGQPRVNPNQSGRLELAEWLSSDHNPLTPRVMANRVWQHLFGKGLVTTVDNFGVSGDAPSHPELLDHLAQRFVDNGWSIKRLVRTLVLSRTYQLSAETTQVNLAIDPSNRLLWRHSPRRLDAEEIRDAMLAAAGGLNPARPDESPVQSLRVIEVPNDGYVANRLLEAGRVSSHRSIYLPQLRVLTPAALKVFDFAEQGMVTGLRDQTTVAPQALYLLNDPFVRRQSLALAEGLLDQTELDDLERIHRAYWLAVCRPPTSRELDRAIGYLAEYAEAQEVLLASSHTLNSVSAVAQTTSRTTGNDDGANSESATAFSFEQNLNSTDERTGITLEQAPEIEISMMAAQIIPVDPDGISPPDPSLGEEPIVVRDVRSLAWASFCQALFGAAEFRFLR